MLVVFTMNRKQAFIDSSISSSYKFMIFHSGTYGASHNVKYVYFRCRGPMIKEE